MNTRTSSTQGDLNICLAADDIIELFESLGFTSANPPDVELLRHSIVEIFQKRTAPKVLKSELGKVNPYMKYFKEPSELRPDKNVKVPKYIYSTEGFDPDNLPK